jgi:DNA-binding NtrC family response regulator
VAIYSEPGEGTTVRIYLPRCYAEEGVVQEQQSARLLKGDPTETILVVEDDEDVRSYLIDTLSDLGYDVLYAADSAAALRILGERGALIDLMLTDVVLPGMNGRQLAREAQVVRPGLKVLYMTGYSRNAIVHQGRLDPDVELIQKPVTQDLLAARVRGMLDGKSTK